MSSYIYFIGPRDRSVPRVKIGVTASHPTGRLSTFRTGSPFPLEIYGFVHEHPRYERALHQVFSPLSLHGEWFRLEGKLRFTLDIAAMFHGRGREWRDLDFWEICTRVLCSSDSPYPDQTNAEWVASASPRALIQYDARFEDLLEYRGYAHG